MDKVANTVFLSMKDKVRLYIADALQTCFNGGPVNMKSQRYGTRSDYFLEPNLWLLIGLGLRL